MRSGPQNERPALAIKKESFDLRKQIFSYLKHWKWFVLSSAVFITLAYFHLRYATPEYAAYGKIMLIDDKNASTPGTAILKDLELLSERENKKVEDEIEVLKSRRLMAEVVKNLGLNIRYFKKGRIHDTELFPTAPFKLNFIVSDSVVYGSKYNFFIEIDSETTFKFYVNQNDQPKKMTFGESIPSPIGSMVITPNTDNFKTLMNIPIQVKITPVNELAEAYKSRVTITPVDKFSKVLDITLNDAVRKKAIAIINELVSVYNEITINEKNQESKNTADFINERIDLIATDLSNVDKNAERFKTGNRLTDITSEADIYLNSGSLTEEQLSSSKTELNLINYMRDYLEDAQSGYDPLPANVGLSDQSILNITARYNELVLQRQQLLKSSNEKNPIVVNLDQRLNGLKTELNQSLNNLRNTISIKVNNLQRQSARINSKISSVPGQERRLRDIQRQQQIKESLYLYLLEKREEATISLTATSPNSKVIDAAYSRGGPISPQPKIIYIAAVLLGLIIPFSILYASDLIDNKIHNKEGLEKELVNATIIGEIPRLKKKHRDTVIGRNDRSVFAESFRIIRTNFDYLKRVRRNDKYNNVALVTSTVKGEGKTFFSINMALTFANSDMRVLLIGADIRNPKLHTFLKDKKYRKNNKPGLTDYLYDASLSSQDVIDQIEIQGNKLDILLPGKIPPNPAELLMNNRMESLLEDVSSRYDMVIIDSAPTLLVTDTLLFSQYIGHTFYLTRAGFTEKNLFNFARELHNDNKLNGMMFVVNGVKQSNFGYGAKYGYGYGVDKKRKKFLKTA